MTTEQKKLLWSLLTPELQEALCEIYDEANPKFSCEKQTRRVMCEIFGRDCFPPVNYDELRYRPNDKVIVKEKDGDKPTAYYGCRGTIIKYDDSSVFPWVVEVCGETLQFASYELTTPENFKSEFSDYRGIRDH